MHTKTSKPYTLCIIHQHPRILLAMKKRGFGVGKWNGYGGKVGEGETIEEAAHREIQEEGGIQVTDLKKIGVNTFDFTNKPVMLEVHVFKATKFDGEPVETEEMRPQWFNVDTIPYDTMWKDDGIWLPLFLEDTKFNGYYLFDPTGDTILKSEVTKIK